MKLTNLRYCVLLLVALSIVAPLSIASGVENNQLFNNLKVKDGLPVNEVFTISQDSTGFMWFGTINGFVRYDGYEMRLFRQDESGKVALPDNQITSIAHNHQLGMWVGTYEGLIYFDTQTNESKLIDLGKPREIRCLLLQDDSVLWAGSADGLIKLNPKTNSFQLFNEQNSALGSNIIRSLYIDSEKNLWIGTFDGLNVLHRNGEMEHFDLKGNYKPELKNNLVLAIQPYTKGNDGNLWIGTETGLVLFNRLTHTSNVFNSENTGFGNEVVKCISPQPDGKLYFGTDFGFYYFDSKTSTFSVSLHDPFNNYSLSNNVVWDIFQDNSGIIWLATANGISQLNINQSMFRFTPVFNKSGGLSVGNQVNDLYYDPNQTLWLATKNGVISQHRNGETETFTNDRNSKYPLVFNNINTITGDNLGRIWIGSAGGINVWNPYLKKMYTITADFKLNRGLRSNYISAFITPSDGSFWVSTWGGGLYKAKGNFGNIDDIYFEYIVDFNTNIFSSDKKIWLENKNKIYTIDLATMQVDEKKEINNIVGNRDINSLLVSTKGELWIGLTKQLLKVKLSTNEFSVYDIIAGKESSVNNLMEDSNGNIWGTTLTTIFRLPANNSDVEVFPMNKGIPLDVFLGQSNAQSRNGEISLGGNDGYISFNPSGIKKNIFCPRTVLTEMRVNNKPIEKVNELKGHNSSEKLVSYFDKKIVLKYDQHSVSIGFASLHFGDPYRNIYAYKLEGFDKEWNYTTGFQNIATYSNLPPDNYIFKVKGTNNDGVWFDNATSLEIVVKPPFWANAWAIVLYIALFQTVLTLLFFTYRNKVQFKARINAITLEKEKNEELAQAKQLFFTNISHEFRTPLGLIIGPVQTILEKHELSSNTRDLLQLVTKNSRRLLSLVNQLLDIRSIENKTLRLNEQQIEIVSFFHEQYELFVDVATNQKVNFTYKAPNSIFHWVADMAKLESIVQNLLSNAFKFTAEGGSVDFIVEVTEQQHLLISVTDTGTGIAPEEQPHIFKRFYQGKKSSKKQTGNGIGLNLAKEYCELMNGTIRFESQQGTGTTFIVEIPISETITQEKLPNPTYTTTAAQTPQKQNQINRLPNESKLATLLIVDDNPDTIDFIRISQAGKYHFLCAPNGKAALKLLDKQKVNLIISDIMMPEIDGLSLCEQVKRNPKYSNTPIILLTAMAGNSEHIDGFRAGADAYLTKPFSTEVLEARIEGLLQHTRKVEEYIKQKLIIENQGVEVESHNEKLLQETIQYINQHINDPEINIDKMCKTIGVSHSSLYRKVKNQTGLTLNELIRQVKLKRAAQLIKSKKLSIAEIMDETGFTNHSYFAKCFKSEYGISPREYAEKK